MEANNAFIPSTEKNFVAKSSTENSRREVEKCSVHRSGSSAHEGPHKGLVVSKKADLAHEVFTKELAKAVVRAQIKLFRSRRSP